MIDHILTDKECTLDYSSATVFNYKHYLLFPQIESTNYKA